MGSEVTCVHGRQYGDCFPCMIMLVNMRPVCPECGNDVVAEGQDMCSDCLWEQKWGESEDPHQGK